MSISKVAVAGATGRLGRHVVDVLAERGHQVVPMSRATGVDTVGRAVRLDDGEVVEYDRLLIATGGSARRLPGIDDDRVLYLRSRHDAEKTTPLEEVA